MHESEIAQEEPNLRTYWNIIRNGWWILVLSVVVSATAAYYVSTTITPIYQAKTKILVQGGQAPGIPSVGEIQASQQLAKNYSDLIKTRPILDQVIDSLSLPYDASALSGKVSVKSPRSLIEIEVSDPDPQMASQIANTTAQTFIEDLRDRQFNQIAQFQTSLGQYGITDDPNLSSAQAAALNTLSIVEAAIPASFQSSPNIRLNVILAAFMGFLIGGILVLLIEYLDDRIKSPDELENMTSLRSIGGLSFLGSVLRQNVKPDSFQTIIAGWHGNSALAKSFK